MIDPTQKSLAFRHIDGQNPNRFRLHDPPEDFTTNRVANRATIALDFREVLPMKRWAFGFLAFLSTLGIGTAVAVSFVFSSETERVSEPILETVQVSVIQTDSKDDSVPEFRDLPDFDQIKYRKPPGNLIHILGDGVYRRSDVVAKSGETWMVLTKNHNFSISKHKADVKYLNSESWPGDEKDAMLSFPTLPTPPLIAMKNVRGVKPGPILTFYDSNWATDDHTESDDSQLSTGYNRKFVIGTREFVLRTGLGITRDGSKAHVLVLEADGVKQLVKQMPYFGGEMEIIGSLLWAGDMDGDGKLDLYFDEFNEKGFTATELQLSTYAENGKLVGLAADFGMPGC